jgi:peptide/nickel transport system substrate-binding protein
MMRTLEPAVPETRLPRLAVVLAGLAFAIAPAQAQRTLTVAAGAAPTTLDPHASSSLANNATRQQLYDALVDGDARGVLRPRLAEAWRTLDDRTWEFRLREGVRFHDGTPFEAEDVAFSYSRVPADTAFAAYVRGIAAIEMVDARTLLIRTREPNPFLDRELANVLILSRRVHADAKTADIDSGRLAIGTGPYRHVAFTPGERHEIAANPAFWGGKPPWDRVTTRYVTDAAARVAALLSGEADLIDRVPSRDVARLSADPRIAVSGGDGLSIVFLFPDAVRERVSFVEDRQGRPLERNPLRDRRVREALSLAIDRQGIVERALHGQGRPAEQLATPSMFERAPDLPPLPFDPERARRLLAEAGHPDGFRMAVHGRAGWFPGSEEMLREIAAAFTRVGVETKAELVPQRGPWVDGEATLALSWDAWLNTANLLRMTVMTPDPAVGAGVGNFQNYSNPAVDGPLAEALRTMDPARRAALTAQAMRALMEDGGVIPIASLRDNWAGRRDRVRYDPHFGGRTSALFAKPAD